MFPLLFYVATISIVFFSVGEFGWEFLQVPALTAAQCKMIHPKLV